MHALQTTSAIKTCLKRACKFSTRNPAILIRRGIYTFFATTFCVSRLTANIHSPIYNFPVVYHSNAFYPLNSHPNGSSLPKYNYPVDNFPKFRQYLRYMDLLGYFKLDEEAYRISPNPRFLYLNDQVKEAAAKIEYMTKNRTAPLYMYGDIGSGKTSILKRLYEKLHDQEDYNLKLLIAPNIKAANAFLRAIMDAFGVQTDRSYDRSLKYFEHFLIEEYKKGRVPTLFVDEAQNMTRDILRLVHYLLNFETSEVKLLQIVLCGQEELSVKVKRYKELKSRMIPIAINPMSPIDLQDMLRFRWSIASGNKSEPPFTASAYEEIYAYSKGLPRDAIKLTDEVLRHLFIRQKQKATGEEVTLAAKSMDMEK